MQGQVRRHRGRAPTYYTVKASAAAQACAIGIADAQPPAGAIDQPAFFA
jgi:hypothetical protein